MGCCQNCMNPFKAREEYQKLTENSHPKYDTANSENTAEIRPSMPRISRSVTRENTYILKIGLLGDIEIYEKRCWLLRLLDEDEFDPEKQTQIEALRNNFISQCNKNFEINNKNYCAQIRIINDVVFMEDHDTDHPDDDEIDIKTFNALLLCYNITNLHSFNKLREYLDKIKEETSNMSLSDKNTLQVMIMAIIPSCKENKDDQDDENQMDESGQTETTKDTEIDRKIDENEAKQLCKEYGLNNIQFVGETNAKTGNNVLDLMQNVIQKCADTQLTQ